MGPRTRQGLAVGAALFAALGAVWASVEPTAWTSRFVGARGTGDGAPTASPEPESDVTDLARWVGVPLLSEPLSVPSWILGSIHSTQSLPARYVVLAEAQDHPLRDAVGRWNSVLEIYAPDELAAMPELYAGDDLPRDLQVAAAALLYSITDATSLQKRALEGLTLEEYARLLSVPGLLLRAVEETGSAANVPGLEGIQAAANRLDLQAIQAASQITASTVEQVLPSLRAWAEAERSADRAPSRLERDLRRFLDSPPVQAVEQVDARGRMAILAEALRLAAASIGYTLSDPGPPVRPSTTEPLREAVERLVAAARAEVDERVLAAELRRAAGLPYSLQEALAVVVLNYAAWIEEATRGDFDPAREFPGAGPVLEAQLRFVEALREAAPLLEAWGLVLGHGPSRLLPKNAAESPYAILGVSDLARRLRSPGAGLQEVVRSASALQGGPAAAVEAPPLPPRGALADALVRLYGMLGATSAPALREPLLEAASRLPEPVERNTARVLFAQLDAVDELTRLYQGLSVEDLRALAAGDELKARLASGGFEARDLPDLRRHYEALDRVIGAYYGASLRLAAAMDAAQEELSSFASRHETEPRQAGPPKLPFGLGWLLPLLLQGRLVGMASAQDSGTEESEPLCVDLDDLATDLDAVHDSFHEAFTQIWSNLFLTINQLLPAGGVALQPPVPPRERDYEMSRCDQDVLFQDPILETVVISGVGRTVYDPRTIGVSHRYGTHRQFFFGLIVTSPEYGFDGEAMGRGQMLSIDLGGDDAYLNNAGGGLLSFFVQEAAKNDRTTFTPYAHLALDPATVGVALDLSGDDTYGEPPSGVFRDAVQGSGFGGIGFLWDVSGDDNRAARRNAQGHGSGFVDQLRPDFPCVDRNLNDAVVGASLGSSSFVRLHPYCFYALHGVGVLLDSGGNDRYAARDSSQGVGGPSGSHIPLSELRSLNSAFGGSGVLFDAAGDDHYALVGAPDGNWGQGAADGGLGLLLDGDGADVYRGGAQGQARGGGFGALADLDMQDRYTRTDPATGARFGDGDCAAEVGIDTAAPGRVVPISVGIFLDASPPGTCRVKSPFEAGGAPEPDQLLEDAIRILNFGLVDEDRDGWIQALEDGTRRLPPGLPGPPPRSGWNDKDRADYPAGLPREPPPEWPLDQWPPDTFGQPVPYGSPFLVHVPEVLLVGDAIPNAYAQGRDFRLQLDVGGGDTYLNRAAGATTGSLTTVNALQPVLVDFGSDDDSYIGPPQSQAFNGFLFELGGNDTYFADQAGQAVVELGGPAFWKNAVLFDAAGNDTYTVQPAPCPPNTPTCTDTGFQETLAHATVRHTAGGTPAPGFVILLDASGDDRYYSGRQSVVEPLSGSQVPVTTLFLDLAGRDEYRPVHRRADVMGTPSGHHAAAFVDNGGWDRYRGLVFGNEVPDLSALHNNRVRTEVVAQSRSRFAWDQDRLNRTVEAERSAFEFPGLGILIGRLSDDRHLDSYALLIEPGGDDEYRNNAGGTLFRAGEEPRLGPAFSCPPCALDTQPSNTFPVAAVLVDLEGDDLYDAGAVPGTSVAASEVGFVPGGTRPVPQRDPQPATLVQGAGFLGVGILVDDQGADAYRARAQAQGFGLLGAGILWDRSGDDSYGYGPQVVAEPRLSGRLAIWQELRLGAWELVARYSDPLVGLECDFDPVPPGFAGEVRDAAVDRGRIAFSYRDALGAWKLAQVIPSAPTSDACATTLTLREASGFRSSQVHAAFSGSRLVWQDDRNGDQDIFWRDMTNPLLLEEPIAVGPSNQTSPDAADDAVVWQDDSGGASSIWLLNAETRLRQRISPPGGSHTRPRVSDVFAAWEVERGGAQGSNIMVYDRSRAAVRELDLPGDQVGTDVSGSTILYEDRSGAEPRIMQYDWLRDTSITVRERASFPSLDPEDRDRFVWVDLAGTPGTPVGKPYWNAVRSNQRLGLTGDLRLSQSVPGREYNPFLQGAAWQFAAGFLLDQSGLDRYDAGTNSQGASFSVAGPVGVSGLVVPVQTTNLNYQQSAYGVLADLEGNDAYRARSQAQGSQVATPLQVEVVANNNAVPGVYHVSHNLGLLLDGRGADAYAANGAAQGSGGWAYHAAGPIVRPAAPLPQVIVRAEASVVNSLGILADLGGLDGYEYGGQVAVTSVPDCGPLPGPVVDLVREVQALVGDQCAGLSPDPRPERHNAFWHNPALAVVANPETGADVAPRGVGVDASLGDALDEVFRRQAEPLYDIEIEAYESVGGSPLTELAGDIVLGARVFETAPQETFDIKRLEFFINDEFVGYGFPEPACPGAACRRVFWSTDGTDVPDGAYEVRVSALVGLRGSVAFSGPIGSVEESRQFLVDNPPRLEAASVAPVFFGPYPFSAEPEIPGLPVVSFTTSPEPSLPGGYGFAQVRIISADGAELRRLREFSSGEILDSPLLMPWDGLTDAGGPAPSGAHAVEIVLTDRSEETDRRPPFLLPVDVDRDPPAGGCLALGVAASCAGELAINLLNSNLQEGTGSSAAVFRVLAQDGSPIRRTHVFVQDVATGSWSYETTPSLSWTHLFQDGDEKRIVVLAEDLAGNLECHPGCGAYAVSPVDRGSPDVLEAAREAKLDASPSPGRFPFLLVRTDLRRPQVIVPPTFFSWGDQHAAITDVPRINGLEDLRVRFDVRESGSFVSAQPLNVDLLWESFEDPTLVRRDPVEPTPDPSEPGRYQVSWSGWPGLVGAWGADLEGLIGVTLLVEDAGGNRGDAFSAQVLLDRTAPLVSEVAVSYPEGRSYALPGDEVTFHVKGRDPALLGFEVPQRKLDLRLDASRATTSPGANDVKLVFDAALGEFLTLPPVEILPPPDLVGQPATNLALRLLATDISGNTRPIDVPFVLGKPEIGLSLVSEEVGVREARIAWSTDFPATVELDLLSTGLPGRTVGPTVLDLVHVFELGELQPGTQYSYRLTARNATGAVETASPRTFSTPLGVDLFVKSPQSGEFLSGLADLLILASVDADPSAEPRVSVSLRNDSLPSGSKLVADDFTQEGVFRLELVSDALPDGIYAMEVVAEFRGEVVRRTIPGVVIDNEGPRLRIVEPADGAALSADPGEVVVEVRDDLGHIVAESVQVRLNGESSAGLRALFRPGGNPREGVLVVRGLPEFPEGSVRISVLVEDVGGNVGTALANITKDTTAPELTGGLVEYPPGQGAARSGQAVGFRILAADAAGIARVFVDARPLLGPAELELVREADRYRADLMVGDVLEEGEVPLSVTLVDRQGNTRRHEVEVRVDNRVPSLVGRELVPVSAQAARLGLHVSEPVFAEASLSSALETIGGVLEPGPGARGQELAFAFNGLRPGEEYRLRIRASDAAGNAFELDEAWRFMPVLAPPPPVASLSATIADPLAVVLRWQVPPGARTDGAQYVVYRSPGGAFEELGTVSVPVFEDPSVEPARRYAYFVQPKNLVGEAGEPSAVLTVDVPRRARAASFGVYPGEGVEGTPFRFLLDLEGAQGAEPDAWLSLNGDLYKMSPRAAGADCRLACSLEVVRRLPALDLRVPENHFHAEVFEEDAVLRFPEEGMRSGPIVVARPEGLAGAAAEDAAVAPGPTVFWILLLSLGWLVVRRRNAS